MPRVFAHVTLALALAAATLPSDPPPRAEADGVAAAGPAAPGVIEGILQMERRPSRRVAQRYPGAAAGSSHTIQPIPPLVFLRGPVAASGGGAADASAEPLVIAQRDTTFQPSLLVVRTGDTVAFPNRDPFFHNVFSYSGAARFDLGRYPEGESKAVTLDEPGIVRVYCEVHDFMRAAVVVTESPFHARPDDEGRFRIEGVPPGTYTLVGWHADHGAVTQEVTVPDGGRVDVVLGVS